MFLNGDLYERSQEVERLLKADTYHKARTRFLEDTSIAEPLSWEDPMDRVYGTLSLISWHDNANGGRVNVPKINCVDTTSAIYRTF